MNKQQMAEYLRGHFRYDTCNSWNNATSYAAKVKIYNIIPKELQDKAFEILEQGEAIEAINQVLAQFDKAHDYIWQLGFNGRSGGYIVLYHGGIKGKQVFTQPGLATDQGEDFVDWDIELLRERVKLVKEFDRTVEKCKCIFIAYCKDFNVVEEEILVPKTIKVLQPSG